ncbi:hypothetical protein NHQ30_009260 [Ciborinia camelliae]|nr:hypothetical protein NHQ30_009260 [Ciborinia camelliae]
MVGKTGCCTVCTKACALACLGCRFTEYCSEECRRRDYPRHKLLCASYGIMIGSARPTPDAKLAFFFAAPMVGGPQVPELIWWENNTRVVEDGAGNVAYINVLAEGEQYKDPEVGSTAILNDYGSAKQFNDNAPAGRALGHTLIVHHRDSQGSNSSVANMGIFKATNYSLAKMWRGPVVVYSLKNINMTYSSIRKTPQDVTMYDFRMAINYFKFYKKEEGGASNFSPEALSKGWLFRLEKSRPEIFENLMVKYAGDAKPIKGVRLSCVRDVHLGKEEYEPMDVLPNHPIFHANRPDPHADIIEQLQIPFIARKICPDDRLYPANSDPNTLHYNPLENEAAVALNLIVDVKGRRFKFPNFKNDWTRNLGSVMLVRGDKKDLTVRQAKALVAFCISKVEWEHGIEWFLLYKNPVFEDRPEGKIFEMMQGGGRGEIRDDAMYLMPLDRQFQVFFDEFKLVHRLGNRDLGVPGDETWVDEVSPYDV